MNPSVYEHIQRKLTDGEGVLLDGGVATEIGCDAIVEEPEESGATWAIYERTQRVLDVHRQYAQAGCDVISTNTWGLLGTAGSERGRRPGRTGLPAWTVATRDAVSLARSGIDHVGRTGDCAVAFSLNDADPLLAGTQNLLALLWDVAPPDLVLIETLTTLPSPALVRAIAEIASAGLPVWLSFRRKGPEPGEAPGTFRGAVAELEQAGVRAILVNCIPVQDVAQAVAELSASTSLPVGCYPRLESPCDPQTYARLARGWWDVRARIIGGCCGVGARHISAVRDRWASAAAARMGIQA